MRGQSGINSGVLIILVTVALVLYVLMLPADVRDNLLNDGSTTGSGSSGGNGGFSTSNNVLLDTVPGRIDFTSIRDRTHTLPSFQIQISRQPAVIKSADSITVTNGAFDKESKTLSFDVEPEATNNLLLTFNVLESDGGLVIQFNGEEILNRELPQGSVDPIVLQTNTFDNDLVFFATSPGWLLFNKHEVVLSNIRVTGELTDFSASESTQTFSITQEEFDTMTTAELSFKPVCRAKSVGLSKIWLNGEEVFSGVPDCGFLTKIDLPTESINVGGNQLFFSSEKGSYIVDQAKVITETSSTGSPSFFFDMDKKYFDDDDDLESGTDIIMEIFFTDNDGSKSGTIEVNGHDFSFRTSGQRLQRRLDAFVERGTNEIEINGRNLDIARLRVLVED